MKSELRVSVGIKFKEAIFDSSDLYSKEDMFLLGALAKDMEYYTRLRDSLKSNCQLNSIEMHEWDSFYSALEKVHAYMLYEAICDELDEIK